jgi:hypothetical protein
MGKYSFSVVSVVAMICDTIIPAVVPAEYLAWMRWRIAILLFALIAIGGVVAQAIFARREERKRDKKDEDRDIREAETSRKIDELHKRSESSPSPLPVASVATTAPPAQPSDPEFEGELRRIFTFPRTAVGYQMYVELWKLTHSTDEPTIDTDVLVNMYVVNRSSVTKYIKDVTGSVEVGGIRRSMERVDHFHLQMKGTAMDYGLDGDEETQPLKPLITTFPMKVEPGEPLDGWIRFMLRDINPEKINADSWQFAIVDSLGNDHPITSTSAEPKKGQIAFMRQR